MATVNSVLHVLPHLGKPASGPAYSVARLCGAQAQSGLDVAVATLDKYRPSARRDSTGFNIHAFATDRLVPRLCASSQMKRNLPSLAFGVDILHSHGLWLMPHLYASATARASGKPIVISPRGGLAPWARGRSGFYKGVVGRLGQASALREATAFHATSEAELGDIRSAGYRQPVLLVPNGVDLPPPHAVQPRATRTLLFLARIHPTKGLDMLLKAWRELEPRYTDWSLVIAGPDCDGHLGEMVRLAESLGLSRVQFPGPVYGSGKFELMADADLYVLPSHTENFGLTVAEALSAGTPAIVGKGAPWAGLEAHRAGWWVDLTVASLVQALDRAMMLPMSERADMGRNGRRWIERDFSWPSLAERMIEGYRWILGAGGRPGWVHEA